MSISSLSERHVQHAIDEDAWRDNRLGCQFASAATLRVIAMVSLAAIAITGLKFRALSR